MDMKYISLDKKMAVDFERNDIKLPNGNECYVEVSRFAKPEDADEKDVDDFLKAFENHVDTVLCDKFGMQGVFPHFYIRCPYDESLDDLIKLLPMTFVEELRLLLCPAFPDLGFQRDWDAYQHYKLMNNEKVLVVNAAGTEGDGSMIQHWIDHTHYEFDFAPYTCPATLETLGRDGLDGAHVKIVGYPGMGLFITPVQKRFNESHSRKPFYVKPEYLVEAPKNE